MQYKYFKRILRKTRRYPAYLLIYRIPDEVVQNGSHFAEFTSTLPTSSNYGNWKASREVWASGVKISRKKWKLIPITQEDVMLILM